jgi:hypothetical protein
MLIPASENMRAEVSPARHDRGRLREVIAPMRA